MGVFKFLYNREHTISRLIVLSILFAFILLSSLVSCGRVTILDAEELESRIVQIEADSVFSFDTIFSGEWTHFCVIPPYMNSDSLIRARGIKCKDADLSTIRSSALFDGISTFLILEDDTLKQMATISRLVLDFLDISDDDNLQIFGREQKFILNGDRSIAIYKEPEEKSFE